MRIPVAIALLPFLGVGVGVLYSGCAEPTAIRVEVISDVPCSADAQVELRVADVASDLANNAPSGAATMCESMPDGRVRRGNVVVVPAGSRDKPIAFQLTTRNDALPAESCSASNSAGCIVARRQLRFTNHRTLDLTVDLRLSCLGVFCDPNSTCVRSRCLSAVVPENCEGPCDETTLAGFSPESPITTTSTSTSPGDSGSDATVDATTVVDPIAALCGNMSGLQAGSPWPMAGRCPTRVGLTPVRGPRTAPSEAWHRIYDWPSSGTGPAIAADGTVYGAAQDGSDIALFAFGSDGSRKWYLQSFIGAGGSPTIAANGDVLFCTTGCSRVSPSGVAAPLVGTDVSDSGPDVGAYLSAVIAPDGAGFVAGDLGKLQTLPATWSATPSQTASPLQSPALSADGKTVFTASSSGAYAFATSDGTPRWAVPITSALSTAWPVVAGDRVYVVGKELSALDVATGKSLWSLPLNAGSAPSVASAPAVGPDGTVFVCAANTLVAVHPNGVKAWTYNVTGGTCVTPIVDADGFVYSASGSLFALRPDGTELWRLPIKNDAGYSGYATASMAMDATGGIYVPGAYVLYAYR